MRNPKISIACCPKRDCLPTHVDCFIEGISNELNQLICRHRRLTTQRRRIRELAKPNYRALRYVPKCACKFKNSIELICQSNSPVRTRTEQLSFPKARTLLILKDEVAKKFSETRVLAMNRLIHKSLCSMYSRLANVKPPKRKFSVAKMNKKEWKQHIRYFKKLAIPKKPPKKPKIERTHMDIKEMKRFKKLAKPKRREEIENESWMLTPELKYYNATRRVLNLAKPKVYDETVLNQSLPVKVPKTALKYNASDRIKELSMALEKRGVDSDVKENPFAIAPNALKAKASSRIKELAEPKDYENVHIRENPGLISPAALKAKASPRIIELAKPRGS